MTKKQLDAPEFAPTGYEWLPRAYDYYIEPMGFYAKELTRRALADGRIAAMLLVPSSGKRHPIPQHVWDQTPVAEKVYPRFDNGWMQIELEDKAGSVVEGWIFFPLKMLKEVELPTLSYDPDVEQFKEPPFEARYNEPNVTGIAELGEKASTTDDHPTNPTKGKRWPKKPEKRDLWRDWWKRYQDMVALGHGRGKLQCARMIAKDELGYTTIHSDAVSSRAETIRKALGTMIAAGTPPIN